MTNNQPATPSKATAGALPTEWIGALFGRLGMIYGTEKVQAMWRGQDLAEVKEYWGRELARFTGDELRAGFARLRQTHPDWPPTLYEFEALCRASVRPQADKRLPAPDDTPPGKVEELVTRLTTGRPAAPRAWAKNILDRVAAGEIMPAIAINRARAADAGRFGDERDGL